MSERFTRSEFKDLKMHFSAAGCEVQDLDKFSFEIVKSDFPIVTRVDANPYYLELATVIELGRPLTGDSEHNDLLALVNEFNTESSLVKFTVELEDRSARPIDAVIMALVRFVTGDSGHRYQADALANLTHLWLQDIAGVLSSENDFDLHGMMKPQSS